MLAPTTISTLLINYAGKLRKEQILSDRLRINIHIHYCIHLKEHTIYSFQNRYAFPIKPPHTFFCQSNKRRLYPCYPLSFRSFPSKTTTASQLCGNLRFVSKFDNCTKWHQSFGKVYIFPGLPPRVASSETERAANISARQADSSHITFAQVKAVAHRRCIVVQLFGKLTNPNFQTLF